MIYTVYASKYHIYYGLLNIYLRLRIYCKNTELLKHITKNLPEKGEATASPSLVKSTALSDTTVLYYNKLKCPAKDCQSLVLSNMAYRKNSEVFCSEQIFFGITFNICIFH